MKQQRTASSIQLISLSGPIHPNLLDGDIRAAPELFLGSAAVPANTAGAHAPGVAGPVVPPEGAVLAGQTLGKLELDRDVAALRTNLEFVTAIGKFDWMSVETLLGFNVLGSLQRADGELEVAQMVGGEIYHGSDTLARFVTAR